jgi:tetratricopeptide (TPR) repeat protein
VPIDRAAALKNAEKLLRQGKLEPAIAEYIKVVEDQPRDWNSANALGDLYVRANQINKAVEQYIHIADSLNEEGFLPKAAALYKKIIKIKPDHEHALLQAAEIAASQSLYADARAYLTTVADKRLAAGDKRGHAQMRIRIGNLDPADYDARIVAARARQDINDPAGAVRDLKEIAQELTEKGRQADAIAVLREAAALAPDDDGIRALLLDVYVAAEDFANARACATRPEQFKRLAEALETRGRADEALVMLCDAARADPADAPLRAQLARTFVARGDLTAAAEYLTEESAEGDPQLLLTVAEMRLRAGRIDEGVAIARRLLAEDARRRDQVALVGWNIAEQAPDAAYTLVELAADASVVESDWANAAAALQEFVTRVPTHVPALLRLVEICVDGSLEATLHSAQAQLADAYIDAGMAAEARFIAEDLVAREPWERANIDRFRRTLVLMNESDPDKLIADRLSGQSPFMSTDLNAGEFPPFEPTPTAPPPAPAVPARDDIKTAPVAGAAGSGKKAARPTAASAHSIDIDSLLGDLEPAKPARGPSRTSAGEAVELDLSAVFDAHVAAPPSPASAQAADIDSVLSGIRDEASRRSLTDAAESEYRRGLALQKAGDVDGAIVALKTASQAPTLRFATASLLGRIHRERGMLPQALEWLERAAQAPAPSPAEYHQLLYELADGLESSGEIARALAICLELQADAGSYRDVAVRVDRLAKVQARE